MREKKDRKRARSLESRIYHIIILLIVFLGLFVRILDIGTHFTHVDDLAVINDIKSDFSFDRYYEDFLYNEEYENYGTTRFEMIRRIDRTGVFMLLESVVDHNPFRFLKIFFTTTYAPGQYFITQWLVHDELPYRTQLALARLPSLAMAILSFILYIVLMREMSKDDLPLIASGLVILALSWSFIINSKLSYHYAAGVPVLLFLMILLRRTSLSGPRSAAILGASIFFLVLFQYQLVVFVPPFFLALLHKYKYAFRKKLSCFLVSGGVFSILFLPLLVLKLSGLQAVHWNAGESGQFLFSWSEPFSFLTKNAFLVFVNLASFSKESLLLFSLDFLLMLLCLYGICGLFFSRNGRTMAIFMLSSLLIWLSMVLMGRMTLSPTRHSLILLPFLALLVPVGIESFSQAFRRKKLALNVITAGVLIMIFSLFSLDAHSIMRERKDPFSEEKISRTLDMYDVGKVLEDPMTLNLHIMPSMHDEYSYDGSCSCWNSSISEVAVAYMSSRRGPERIPMSFSRAGLNISDYKLVYNHTIYGDASFEFIDRTPVGYNDLIFLIYTRG